MGVPKMSGRTIQCIRPKHNRTISIIKTCFLLLMPNMLARNHQGRRFQSSKLLSITVISSVRVAMSTSNTEARDFSVSTLALLPLSTRWTVRTFRPEKVASCSWDQPFLTLSFFTITASISLLCRADHHLMRALSATTIRRHRHDRALKEVRRRLSGTHICTTWRRMAVLDRFDTSKTAKRTSASRYAGSRSRNKLSFLQRRRSPTYL